MGCHSLLQVLKKYHHDANALITRLLQLIYWVIINKNQMFKFKPFLFNILQLLANVYEADKEYLSNVRFSIITVLSSKIAVLQTCWFPKFQKLLHVTDDLLFSRFQHHCPSAHWFLNFLNAGSVAWVNDIVGVTFCKPKKLNQLSSSPNTNSMFDCWEPWGVDQKEAD